jgi:hypothetical protein
MATFHQDNNKRLLGTVSWLRARDCYAVTPAAEPLGIAKQSTPHLAYTARCRRSLYSRCSTLTACCSGPLWMGSRPIVRAMCLANSTLARTGSGENSCNRPGAQAHQSPTGSSFWPCFAWEQDDEA